jgi:hypothetical protein
LGRKKGALIHNAYFGSWQTNVLVIGVEHSIHPMQGAWNSGHSGGKEAS